MARMDKRKRSSSGDAAASPEERSKKSRKDKTVLASDSSSDSDSDSSSAAKVAKVSKSKSKSKSKDSKTEKSNKTSRKNKKRSSSSDSSSSSSSSLEPHSDRVRASGLLHGGDGFPPSRACFHVSKQAREQACVEPSREPSAVESLSFRRDALISRRTSCRMYAPRFQANLKLSNCAPGTARFGFAAALPAWASCLVG
mmetsp:Transcript_9376/g.15619  ORF Transcript_9376/g.15619 Transcript_9376/m.15619 type:complete len:198 (+) Transcript_9376:137-730(+)